MIDAASIFYECAGMEDGRRGRRKALVLMLLVCG